MACALFGKTPSKRDFIAPGVPRQFLSVWEPWMQAGLATSQMVLDRGWHDKYLTAPIWRFWLGAEICGTSCLGAFMPSMDGIGRYYPLTVLAFAPGGAAFVPPDMDTQPGWFAAAENFLLDTLEVNATYDAIQAALADLPDPEAADPAHLPAKIISPAPTCLSAPIDDTDEASVFAALRGAAWDNLHASRACFWTLGGPGFRPRALSARGLPRPELFTALLTGMFEVNAPQSAT